MTTTLTPNGDVDGRPVRWFENRISGQILVGDSRAYHQELRRVQYAGVGDRTLRLSFGVGGANHRRDAKDLFHHLSLTSPVLLRDTDGVYFDDEYAWLQPERPREDHNPEFTTLDFQAVYQGHPDQMALGVIVTSRHLANDFSEVGRTAIHLPGDAVPVGESVSDPARNVVEAPSFFATHDSTYVADAVLRNALAPVEAALATLSTYASNFPGVLEGSRVVDGGSRAFAEDAVLRTVAIDVTIDQSGDKLTFADRIGTATDQDLVLDSYASAFYAHARAGLPSTPQRRVVQLSNGVYLVAQDNGNILIYASEGATFRLPGAATRSLGTGVFWHEVKTDTYLTGTKDYAIDGSGNVTWTGDAIFSLIFTDLTGTPREDRLREGLTEILPSWVLVRRTQ